MSYACVAIGMVHAIARTRPCQVDVRWTGGSARFMLGFGAGMVRARVFWTVYGFAASLPKTLHGNSLRMQRLWKLRFGA